MISKSSSDAQNPDFSAQVTPLNSTFFTAPSLTKFDARNCVEIFGVLLLNIKSRGQVWWSCLNLSCLKKVNILTAFSTFTQEGCSKKANAALTKPEFPDYYSVTIKHRTPKSSMPLTWIVNHHLKQQNGLSNKKYLSNIVRTAIKNLRGPLHLAEPTINPKQHLRFKSVYYHKFKILNKLKITRVRSMTYP